MTRVEKLKAKGFNFIKLELEADMDRDGEYCEYCDEGEVECCTCDGSGNIPCDDCEGTGEVPDDDGEGVHDCNACGGDGYIECTDCEGTGRETCNECDGNFDGYGDEVSENAIQRYFTSILPKKIRDSLTYIDCYNDGSVDTEITLTYPVEHIGLTTEVVDCMNKTADHFNKELRTDNAGFHISICETANPDDSRLDEDKLKNFASEVRKFMAGMYLIASGSDYTRGFGYRSPDISLEGRGHCAGEKYSAIYTHNKKYLEYRIFDTCYHQPELVMDFIDMIISTLKYYSTSKNRLDDYASTGMKNEQLLKDAFIDDDSKARAIREMGYLLSKGKVEKHIKKIGLEK